MRYLIITKKHVRILKLLSAVTASIITASCIISHFYPKAVQTFSPQKILKNQLPREEKQIKFSDLAKKALGFSPDDPSSIISEYSSVFPNGTQAPSVTAPTQIPVQASTSSPEPTPTESADEAPQYNIKEKTIKNPNQIKNETDFNVTLSEFENESIKLSKPATVLIVHTHTTESYAPEEEDMHFIDDNSRSCDSSKNMIAIGNELSEKLRQNGINVIHDTTFHDYPVYNGAYGRSLSTIKAQMHANNNINVVLDVHRDAVVSSDGTRTKVIADINGTRAAQIMLVVGTNGSGLNHPGWHDNLAFAAKIQGLTEDKYPGLMRPLNLREERFNQHMTPCSLIIEVGTNANTLSEAKTGVALVGDCIAELLK